MLTVLGRSAKYCWEDPRTTFLISSKSGGASRKIPPKLKSLADTSSYRERLW
jgi:hypothetical protein